MDSTGGNFMQYHNDNDPDLTQFFDGLESYAAEDNDGSSQFDPALFTSNNGLPSYQQQQNQMSQSTQAAFTPAQRQSQSQSPGLAQFKQSSTSFSPQQYAQSLYNPQSMAQNFDPRMSRPTPSPGAFDQYRYQQQMGYGQPGFNYQFNNFNRQQHTPTPAQAFRPEAIQQAQQQYLNGSRQSPQLPQAHVSQVQNTNGSGLTYPYQQGQQIGQRFVNPSMVSGQGQPQQSVACVNQQSQMQSSPYFTMPGSATIDPRQAQMQQYQIQLQRAQLSASGHHTNGPQSQQLQPNLQYSAHTAPQASGQMPKGVSTSKIKGGKSSGSGSSSDEDDLEIEDEEEPETRPACITISKPTDEKGKLLWEVVDAVWTPRNKPAPTEKIRSAIKFVGEAVRNLRDKWKAQNEHLKAAENSGNAAQALALKSTVQSYRDTMQVLAERVTRFGHPSVLKSLGEHQYLMAALYSFLLDRATAEDHNSSLVTAILLLGIKLENVDEEQLEKIKWTKILVRFSKRSTNESKTYAQQIINNAKKATARKKTEAAGQAPASPSGSANGKASATVAGVKRPREGPDTSQQAQKKPTVKTASKPLSVQIEERRKLREKEQAAARKDSKEKSTTNGAAGTTVAARPKPTAAMPVKSSPFANLMSASKRPGTTLAEREARAKLDAARSPAPMSFPAASAVPVNSKEGAIKIESQPVKAPATTKPATAATPSSSFMGFLADLGKPPEEKKVEVREDPNEAPDVRAKRLRKESRRKLRVSWKPEIELVEIKMFEHEPEEDTGHTSSQIRDIENKGGEGALLKAANRVVEDEPDEEPDEDLEWFVPSEVDFSPSDEYTENYVKLGGSKSPDSRASKAQDEHELGNLMTNYMRGEQPNTPKEPPEGDDDDFEPATDFGEPSNDGGRVRRREQRVLSARQPYQQPAPAQPNGFDLAAALKAYTPETQTQQNQATDLLRALGVAGQQPQQTQTAVPQIDYNNLFASLQQLNHQQKPQQPQSTYNLPTIPFLSTQQNPTPKTAPTLDVSALLSQLSAANAFGSHSQLQNSSNSTSAPLPLGTGPNPNPWTGISSVNNSDSSTSGVGNKKKDKKGKRGGGGVPLDENGLPINYKTMTCQFWLEGKCNKGEACTYRHDHEGMENPNVGK